MTLFLQHFASTFPTFGSKNYIDFSFQKQEKYFQNATQKGAFKSTNSMSNSDNSFQQREWHSFKRENPVKIQ